ncbi:MAG: ribbon-helix-helix protein, CopG family [Acidobacteriaceae bacterium]
MKSKAKTSITLSSDVLDRIDKVVGRDSSRSAFIEQVLRQYFRSSARRLAHARDLNRINAAADRLNKEALDSL